MQTELKFLDYFLKRPATLSQMARSGGEARLPQRDAEVLLVPAEASVHGGEPILLLLPQPHHGDDRPSADCRYCLVFEGSNRRHLASCELAPAQRGIFSRVPEHDIPERVELSVFADSQRLHSLAFTFTRDPLLGVAANIAEAFPLVPDSLSGLCSGGPAAADTDRRLCAALRKVRSVANAVAEAAEPESEQRTVFHCLAEAGWLESLAHLLRLTARPEFWLLGQRQSAGGPTALQLVRERRFHSALACPSRLRDWLEQLDGRGSRLQGREEAVVSVRSWQTPAGAALVTMTTNKEKADTLLEQDLSLFPTLVAGHVDDHYLLRSSQTQDPVPEPVAPKETACAQTEIGRSIEDLLDGPAEEAYPSAAAEAARHGSSGHFAETDSLVLGAAGEMSMSHSMSQSMSPSMSPSMSHSMSHSMIHSVNNSMTHSMSQSMMRSALFDSTDESRALQQQQQQQLAAPSRSISTTSLIEDAASLSTAWEAAWADDDEAAQHPSQARRRKLNLVAARRQSAEPSQQFADEACASLPWGASAAAHEQRTRKKRKSFLSRLSGSHRAKGGGKIKGGSRLAVYEHNWSIATAGVCAVCEASNSRVCLLSCRACHLTVHNAEACRSHTVSCLPLMTGFASCGAAAPPAAAADSGFVSPTSPGCRSMSISGSPLSHLTEVTEEPFRDRKQSAGGGNQTLPRNFSNSSNAGATSSSTTCDGQDHDEAGGSQHQSAISRSMRANSVSNDRRGTDSTDNSGATWQASATASLRPMSALPGTGGGGGGGSALQQLSEHLSHLSDSRLELLNSESLRRVASWSETQDKRQLKRCGDKQVRRCNFIYELVSTEVTHLRNICVLRAVFRNPLRQFFSSCDTDKLFPHLDELEELHSRLLKDLRDCEPPEGRPPTDWPGIGRVGTVLRRHLGEPRGHDWLRAYGGFCTEHTLRLQKATAGIAQRWPEFSDMLQQCERSPMAGRKTLQDYYLILSQRLSKYKTLFPQISEYCQVAPEDPDMPRACQDLDRLLEGVNATVESSHNRHLLERIAVGFQPAAPEQSSLNVEQLMSRSLLHSGHLRLQTSELKSPVLCFAVLLNDMLVFLQELQGGRYVPLACPNRYVPVIHFSETDAIVRENETGKSKTTFFVIIKKPDPALITLTCMSLEERNKWLRRINQVRDSNPRADERAVEAEKRLREKTKVSAELLTSMEAKDNQLRSLLNEKSQLWKQLLGLWSPSETAAALPEEGADPDQLLRQALQELDGLRRLLHSAPSFAAAAAGSEAASGSLTRSASNAEDKAASSVSLPKRADTFSGYDSRQQQRQAVSAAQDEPLDGSDILLPQQPPPPPPPPPPLTPQPTPAQSKSATTTSGSQSVKARRRSVAADTVSELFGSREKNRRPSVFELMFKRPQRDARGSSVSEEDSGGSDPELRQPDAAGLASLDRLHSLVTGLCRDLLAARTRLAEKFKEEARLRQELDTLRAARETEGHRNQDSLLETIRLQRAELEAEKNRFRDSQKRDQARLDTRKEDMERKEEALRQRQEELERQLASLTEQKRTLQLQFDQYNSMRMQHAKSFSDDLAEPPPPQHPGRPANPHHQPSPSAVLIVPTAGGGGGSLTVSSAKGHSKSASNLAATAAQPQVPPHLTSRLIEDRQARENGGPLLTSPTLHAAAASSRLSPSPSTASGGGAAASTALPPQLPLYLASDSKKRKGSSVFKALRRNGEPDSAVN